MPLDVLNEVTLHLDLLGRTTAGSLFGNLDEKVVVIRWESHANYDEVALLSKMLDEELVTSCANTLFYDMRSIASDEGSALDEAMRLAAISGVTVKNVAWLSHSANLHSFEVVERAVLSQGVTSCSSESFMDATRKLTGGSRYFNANWQEQNGVANFEATYGGSCYTIPEIKTTVLRSAGNYFDLPLAKKMYERSFRLHALTQGSAFILDTSAIPPIMDVARYTFAFDALIRPLVENRGIQQLTHMRVGDAIFPPGLATPQLLAQALESIEFAETSSMAEAVKLIRTTRGLSIAMPFKHRHASGSPASQGLQAELVRGDNV